MQFLEKYFVAANDSNLLSISNEEGQISQSYGDATKQITFRFNEIAHQNAYYFSQLIELMLTNQCERLKANHITAQTFEMLKCRLNGHILAYFGEMDVSDISHKKISQFLLYLQTHNIGSVTIGQYLGLLKRVLYLGVVEGIIQQIPTFPKVKSKSIPRGSFSAIEYKKILQMARSLSQISEVPKPPTHRNTANGAFVKTQSVPKEMIWLIGFMVNTFVRPVDVKLIKHKHIQIIDGATRYLRISMIETKKHTGKIISMRAAVGIYQKVLAYQAERGYGQPEDYIFFPQVSDRQGAISLISGHFKKILDKANLAIGVNNEKRTLYSLRHTAITFRLLYGRGIDLLTLARNARTSVEMIEKFYSSNLEAEMNVEILQSKRTRVG